ncbi:MAG: hypothetical protein HRT66_09155 [Flavobacteriaceae bacterium]|nr:hypothetical protein [Flavobacteriaceae bacterium]
MVDTKLKIRKRNNIRKIIMLLTMLSMFVANSKIINQEGYKTGYINAIIVFSILIFWVCIYYIIRLINSKKKDK